MGFKTPDSIALENGLKCHCGVKGEAVSFQCE